MTLQVLLNNIRSAIRHRYIQETQYKSSPSIFIIIDMDNYVELLSEVNNAGPIYKDSVSGDMYLDGATIVRSYDIKGWKVVAE